MAVPWHRINTRENPTGQYLVVPGYRQLSVGLLHVARGILYIPLYTICNMSGDI